MAVKKVIRKTSPAKSTVIVETKKHEDVACCNNKGKKCFGIFVILLLLLNLLFGIMNYFKASARDIEALKVGGRENLELVKKLYDMDSYKQQQKGAIMQVLGTFVGNNEAPTGEDMPMQVEPTDTQIPNQ